MSDRTQFQPVYRKILQCLLIQQMIPYSTLLVVLDYESDGDCTDLENAIKVINKKIAPFTHRIDIVVCEVTGEKMCVLLSTVTKTEVKCNLTTTQSEYLYELIYAIITSADGYIGENEAINLSSEIEEGQITREIADEYLRVFLMKRLLVYKDGLYFLSALTIAELGPFIHDNFVVDECYLCKEMVISGEKCCNCELVVHRHCFFTYKVSFKKTVKCPKCTKGWDLRRPVR